MDGARPRLRASQTVDEAMKRTAQPRRKILLAANTTQNAFFRGVVRFAREQQWHLVTDMLYAGGFPEGWQGDGIIALPGYKSDFLSYLQQAEIPCVALSIAGDWRATPRVECDNTRIGVMAAEHLLERAYRNFIWAPFADDEMNRDRFGGFQSRLKREHCSCQTLPPILSREGAGWSDASSDRRRTLIEQLRALPRPAAIFAANDCVAADVIDACRDAGISIPEEVAILGVGNDPVICDSVSIPLSSIEQDVEEMAYRAASLLSEMMNGASCGEKVIRVPPQRVVTRLSTDIGAVTNVRVGQALSYIAENYSNPMLGVIDVANAVGISRRHLERSFRAETGSSINEHITKARMQEASRLLAAHPRAKISDISELVGMNLTGNFFRSFRRYYGMSPNTYKKLALNKATLPSLGRACA